MALAPVWDPLERFLWPISASILFLAGILYIRKARQQENKDQRIILYGFAAIVLSQCNYSVNTFFKEMAIPGLLQGLTYYGNYSEIGFLYDLFFKLSWGISWCGFTIFFYTYEKKIKKTKFIFTLTGAFINALHFILPYNTFHNLNLETITFLYFGFIFLTILLIYMKWSAPEFKAIIAYFLLGIDFMGWGAIFMMQTVKELNDIPIFIAPMFYCFAGLFFTLPTLITSKIIDRSLILWLIFSLSSVIMQTIITIFMFMNNFPIQISLLGLLFLIQFSYIEIINLKTIRQILTGKTILNKEQLRPNIFGSFSPPQNLTEEEISISKEKKTCLVCKNKVGGYNFICDECGAFYCEKCAKTLTDMENACWVWCDVQSYMIEFGNWFIAKRVCNKDCQTRNRPRDGRAWLPGHAPLVMTGCEASGTT